MVKDKQYYKFCLYGFLKNLRFFDAFLILFFLEKGISYTEIGILYAIREITINIFEIPSGLIADHYGRKKSLVISFLLYILSFLLFYISANFWFFLVAFILYGAGDAFRSGTHKGMIMDYLRLNHWEDQKINYYGQTRSWSQMGSAISSLIAGGIVFFTGRYSEVFIYSVIPYLMNFLLILSYPNGLNLSIDSKNIKNKKLDFILTLKNLFSVVKSPSVLSIINTAALHTAFVKSIKDYIQPLMIHIVVLVPFAIHMKLEKKGAIVIALIYFVIFILTSLASRFSYLLVSFNKKRISIISLFLGLILGVITGGFYRFEYWYFSLISFVGIYLIENIRKPILTGFISDQVPNEILTSVLSVQSLFKTIFAALFAFSLGVLIDTFNIGMAFILLSSFILVFTFVLFIIGRKREIR